MSCAEGERRLRLRRPRGLEVAHRRARPGAIPATRTQVMLNLANPAAALRWWRLPADGVGLARMEFVVSNHIKVHPMALVRFDTSRRIAQAKSADRRS